VIAGVNWVANNRQKPAVANMSLGGGASASLDSAANGLINTGVVLVVAAGNDDINACNQSPARVPKAITVGSTTSSDARSFFSNWGTCLDIFAPGSSITSAWHTSNTAINTISGTSMASPHVAGVAALYLDSKSNATVTQVRDAIVNASTKNKVTDVAGSPNRLLFSLISGASAVVPTTISPTGTITDRTPTYRWSKINNATKYQIQVFRGTTKVFDATYTSSACSGSNCSKSPAQTLAFAAHKWRVRAFIGGAWKAFSAFKNFTVAPPAVGFDSQFNGDASGWTPAFGSWTVGASEYSTGGEVDNFASTSRSGSYTTLTYEAMMMRTGCVTCSNTLIIRGDPTPLDSLNDWNKGYYFQYSDDGWISVYKVSNSSWTALKPWTFTAAVNQGGWNTLKVTASGGTLKFYVNGILVWSGSDASFGSGQVGLAMYRDDLSAGNNLSVDWAKLATTVAASSDEFELPSGIEVPGGAPYQSPGN
jgi:hypothetical protein